MLAQRNMPFSMVLNITENCCGGGVGGLKCLFDKITVPIFSQSFVENQFGFLDLMYNVLGILQSTHTTLTGPYPAANWNAAYHTCNGIGKSLLIIPTSAKETIISSTYSISVT